jgi:hypothetical protein
MLRIVWAATRPDEGDDAFITKTTYPLSFG